MMKNLVTTLMLLLSLAVSGYAAETACVVQEKAPAALSVQEAGQLLGFAGIKVKSVKPAPVNGMYEVLFEKDGGLGVVWVDAGRRHLIQGMILDLQTKEPVMAHENDIPKPKQFTGVDPKRIPAHNAVTMGNPQSSRQIYVFTDPDCPHCRNLHPVLQELTKKMPDLAIQIMLLPLRQLHPGAYDKARVVVARKSRELLDKAFEGKELPQPKGNEGAKEIDAIIAFAEEQGINGTPMLILPSGSLYQGPRNADEIIKAINSK